MTHTVSDVEAPQGAMTIDVEDYYHVSAFAEAIPRSDWPDWPVRVDGNTQRMLDLFAGTGTKATFFTLGCVAEAHPGLIRRMVAEGHEIASHGWEHWRVWEQDRAGFTEDLRKTRAVLEDISGVAVRGYRAPSFSINAETPWAYEALAEAGYAYSSSSHPIRHDHYGNADAPRGPFREPTAGILEIPVTTLLRGEKRYPCGGGGFFRLLPLFWFRHGIKAALDEGLAPNFYLHPWEIDPDQPRVKAAPLKSRFRHTVGLARAEAKLLKLLRAFRWGRMDAVYATDLQAGDETLAAE